MDATPPTHIPLTQHLREATAPLHRDVERSRWMQLLVRGQAPRVLCLHYLRDLHALYAALESALDASAWWVTHGMLDLPHVRRAHALAADLDALSDSTWTTAPVSPNVERMIATLRAGMHGAQPAPAHAAYVYLRYLGDLHGGQILSRALGRVLGTDTLRYLDFGNTAQVQALIDSTRSALNRVPHAGDQANNVAQQSVLAFRAHSHWFDELVQRSMPSLAQGSFESGVASPHSASTEALGA